MNTNVAGTGKHIRAAASPRQAEEVRGGALRGADAFCCSVCERRDFWRRASGESGILKCWYSSKHEWSYSWASLCFKAQTHRCCASWNHMCYMDNDKDVGSSAGSAQGCSPTARVAGKPTVVI